MAEQADAPQRDVSNTTAEPRERLTDAQSKTVQFLRELGKDDRARRQAALKNYRKYLQEGGGKALPPQADATPSLVSNSRMPVHFNIEADELLHDLPEARGAEGPTGSSPADTGERTADDASGRRRVEVAAIKVLPWEGPAAANAWDSGLTVEREGEDLTVSVRYPKTPLSSRSPESKHQGDVTYRLSIAERSATRISSGDGAGSNGASEVSDRRITERTDGVLPRGPTDDLLENTPRLDDVSWHDFSEIQYALDPQYVQPPVPVSVDLSESDVDLSEDLEGEEIDSTPYRTFSGDLRSAMTRGVIEAYHEAYPTAQLPYDESSGELTASWGVYDIGEIVDNLHELLSPDVFADRLNSAPDG